MRRSTARIMLLWALVSGLLAVVFVGILSAVVASRSYSALRMGAFYGLFGLAIGGAESLLLARTRRPVPRWWIWRGLGSLAAWVLISSAFSSLTQAAGGALLPVRALSYIIGPITYGICTGVATAVALWGRRWPPVGLLWLSAQILLRVLGLGIQGGLTALDPAPAIGTHDLPVWRLVVAGVHGAAMGAGMAWLLDRLVFGPELRGDATPSSPDLSSAASRRGRDAEEDSPQP